MSAPQFVVHKFGGTSVGNAECFAKVSDIVAREQSSRIAVVVSAIGGKPKVTDLLISLLELAKERRASECDAILATIREKHRAVIATLLPADVGAPIEAAIEADITRLSELLRAISIMRSYNDSVVEFISGHGEIWSARILAAVLSQRAARDGHAHRYAFVDARDFLIVDNEGEHGPVVQYELTTQHLQRILRERELTHLVITGFICSTPEGVMTTLKRDGSDFTASICGRVLGASSITIWTDVSGVLSADPRRVPESQILPQVSYQEAMELAYFGAKVIHPKTMTPAVLEGIPIYIRNTFEPEHPGTKIHHRRRRPESPKSRPNPNPNPNSNCSDEKPRDVVSGFSTVDNLALFNIEGSGMVGVHGTSSRLFGALDRIKVNVVLIAQASSEHSICFAVPMQRADDVQRVVDETFFKEIHHGLINKTEFVAPISIIAAVGDNMSHTTGVCSRFFGALGRAKINVVAISQGSSERNISAVVRYEDSAAALRAVHSAFFLSDQTLSIGVVGLELPTDASAAVSVGQELLQQYRQQCEFLKTRFNVDIRIRAIATHSTARMLLDHNGGITADALHAPDAAWEPFDHERFLQHVCADHLPHWLIVDVSNCERHVRELYPSWLARNVHLITSNVNVATASTQQHDALHQTVRANELTFDTEACLAIGVPVFHTLQNFVQTGDAVERLEYSGSRVLHSIVDDVQRQHTPLADAISSRVNEFLASGLSVPDVIEDLTGVRAAKKVVLLARELGIECELADVQVESVWAQGPPANVDASALVAWLVSHRDGLEARLQDGPLRLVAHVDVQAKTLGVKLESAGDKAAPLSPLATLDARQCGFAFYTRRHTRHPVVVTGPIADAAITAGSLFGSVLHVARRCGAHAQPDAA
ncbi:hypothetical protein P43SY_003009 [Pythium insidiosum]|uniref:ACT domain-containing protein n=1 Tax=Pythium insidiosum TaxID=114742 RepID=A0AAD5Q7Z4_PYTIN|nr:hypothetical protein P43SY_003009 [Pythium insidiosum]